MDMEDFLRIILLSIALIILGVIVWEAFKRRATQDVIDFTEEDDKVTGELGAVRVIQVNAQDSSQSEIISVNIMSSSNTFFAGSDILETMRSLGFRYGPYDIFHMYKKQDDVNTDNDKEIILYSLASSFEPGTFNLSEIHTYTTRGLTIFFEANSHDDALRVFENMLWSAKQIASHLNGVLYNDKRCILSKHLIESYRHRIQSTKRYQKIGG